MKRITVYRMALLKAIMESNHTIKEKRALVEAVRNTSDRTLTIKILRKINEGNPVPKKLRHSVFGPEDKAAMAAASGVTFGLTAGKALKHITKTPLKSASSIAGTGIGLLISNLMINYMSKVHKECNKFKSDKIKYYRCRIAATNSALKKLDSFNSTCAKSDNPVKCKNKVKAYKDRWKEELKNDISYLNMYIKRRNKKNKK